MSPSGAQGGRGSTVRRRNLGLVLRSVHLQPQTRSALTLLSGLNRSTIADLVGDLVSRGLVVEEELSPGGQIGRPSLMVRPGDVAAVIAMHPEIDALNVGLVLLGGRVLSKKRISFPVPPSPADVIAAARDAVGELLAAVGSGRWVVGAGVALPAIVRHDDGFVRLAPYLGWREVPLGRDLASALNMSVLVDNDASLGAQAEWMFGAGRGVDDLVYMHAAVTGVGGGIVSGGTLLRGADGHAGEFGHMGVRRTGDPDGIGVRGTLEAEVTRERLSTLLGLGAVDPDTFEAALLASHDAQVRAEVGRQIDQLGMAIANAAMALNPRRVIVGGMLGALLSLDRQRLERVVAERSFQLPGASVEIRRAELGNDLMLIAAAELHFSRLFQDPLTATPASSR